MFTMEIPELEYENAQVEANKVRKNDVVVHQGTRHKVAEVKRGPKWTTLIDRVGGQILRVENDAVILRHQPTEETRKARYEAEYRVAVNERMREQLAKFEPMSRTKAAVAEMQEQLNKGYMPSDYLTTHIVDAQAEDYVYGRFFAAMSLFLEKDPAADLVQFREEYAEELRRTEFRYIRGTSRSTSVVANILDDAKLAAVSKFIDNDFLFL